jgi:hypothetical protein
MLKLDLTFIPTSTWYSIRKSTGTRTEMVRPILQSEENYSIARFEARSARAPGSRCFALASRFSPLRYS